MNVLTVPERNASRPGPGTDKVSPVVVAVDSSAASGVAIGEAVRLAVELDLPIAFAYVRRGPAGFLGAPVYERRLTKELSRARRVLERGLARTAGRPVVVATGAAAGRNSRGGVKGLQTFGY